MPTTLWSWSEIQPYGDLDVSYVDTIMGDDGFIFTGDYNAHYPRSSPDYGVNWDEYQANPPEAGFTSFACSDDGSHLIYCENPGRVWVSTDSGANWTEHRPGGTDANFLWTCVCMDADGSFMGAIQARNTSINSGHCYFTNDSGANWFEPLPAYYGAHWTNSGSNAFRDWKTVACDADGSHIILCQNQSTTFHSVEGGAIDTWYNTAPAYGTRASLNSNGNVMFLVRYPNAAWWSDNQIYKSTDAGANWDEIEPTGDSTGIIWTSISCDQNTGSEDGYMVAATSSIEGEEFGRVYCSSNRGVDWNETQPMGAITAGWNFAAMNTDGTAFVVYGVIPATEEDPEYTRLYLAVIGTGTHIYSVSSVLRNSIKKCSSITWATGVEYLVGEKN
jgi:photosystem II stability/assembly factor-like uncharacterized protein